MRDQTKRGWRGAGSALLITVWAYGFAVVTLGGWRAVGIWTVLIALCAFGVFRVTRTGDHRG